MKGAFSGLALLLLCAPARGRELYFGRDIRPILSDTCFKCHGPDAGARKAKLHLGDRASALKAGVLSDGEMLKRLLSEDPEERMPPLDAPRKLGAEDRAVLVEWLKAGGEWPEDDRHWAFVPPVTPELPVVRDPGWARNGIDHFVLSRLDSEGLRPQPEADKTTLLRRVTLDLTGLPPTIGELDAFLSDQDEKAYENEIDRLLASPRYGEHMGLDWLDASRYADTDGYQNDRLRYMWVWRDWLIRALNSDMPFDRFVIEQMAGDLLPDRNFYTQVATGFNRNHRINSEGGSIPAEWIVEYVADRVETMGTMFLGLTLTCARCHDHKYDPIGQKDFYRLFAFFNNIAEAGLGPNNGNSPPFIKVPRSWPDLSEKDKAFVEPAPAKITIQQTSVPRPQPGASDTVMVLHELSKPRDTYRLERGRYDEPDKSEKLLPSTPGILGPWDKSWPGNRLGLARWLVAPGHPLTGRVTVNRIWQHYFGLGLVKTSDNFGLRGEPPSHPRLLDWLATGFIKNDWKLKALHRLIVTSSVYRQSSAASAELHRRDPENRILARGPRKRLSGNAIRDAALYASGLLVERIGGASVKPYMPPGIWASVSNAKYKRDKGASLYRRSIYTYWRRTLPPPTLMTFNAAAREVCIVKMDQTTTPLQALASMNNIVFVEAARFLAERVLRPQGLNARDRISRAFRLVVSRPPRPEELKILLADLEYYLKDFKKRPAAARRLLAVGAKAFDEKINAARLASYALVANTILNLDETITQN